MAKGLRPLQHVKKKEIKEDKLVTTYFQTRDYFEENKKNLIRYGGGGILLIILAYFWISSKSGSEVQASYELGVAMTTAQQGNPAVMSAEFEQIADHYAGTSAGNEALLYNAQMKRQSGQIEEALTAYDNYIRRGDKDKYLYPGALAGKAACLEDLDRYDEAAQSYLKAAASHKDLFIAPRYLLDAGRCFRLAGAPEKAQEQYQTVLNNYPDTEYSREAERETSVSDPRSI